jgi:tetratricopeptide (TPR) repeat protein
MKSRLKNFVFGLSSLCLLAGVAPAFATEPVVLHRDGAEELGNLYSDSLTGIYAQNIGDAKLAAAAYVSAWEHNKADGELFERAVRAYMVFGDIDNASRIVIPADKALLNDDSKLILAYNALLNGKTSEVNKLLPFDKDSTVFTPTRALFARNLKAWSLARDGKKEEALKIATIPSGVKSIDKAANYSRGLLYQYFGDTDEALSSYETAYQSGVVNSIGIEAYVKLLASKGQKEKALAVLNELKSGVGGDSYYNNLYSLLENDKLHAQKKKDKKQINKYIGSSLGVISLALSGDFRNGSPLSELAISRKFDPELYVINITSARILSALKINDDAIKLLEAVPVNSSNGDQASALLANIVFDTNKTKGIEIAERALKANPSIGNRVSTAIFYIDTKQYDKSIELYNSVITDAASGNSGFELWQLYFGRANAYLGVEDWDNAIKDLRKANELNPNNPSLMNSLGYTLADRNINLPEAQSLLEGAVALDPRSGEILDSLGWVLFRMGKYDEALDRLEIAFSLSPGVGEIAEHLGDAYFRTNRKTEAKLEWEKAARLYEKDSDKSRALDKVAKGLENLPKSKMAQTEKP